VNAGSFAERAAEAFNEKEYSEAVEIYERIIERDPRDAIAHYNLACAHAMLSETDASAESLFTSVKLGFTRFFDMKRDRSLDAIRGHEKYRLIVEHIPEILDARGDAEYEVLASKTSSQYQTARDSLLRLNYASAADDESLEFARNEIGRVAKWTDATVFRLPTDRENDPWISVILPTPEDFIRLVRGSTVGGYYDRDKRRLVSQDTGPSLRHEFFHVLHWRHQERLGQTHPYWVAEGLASVLEDVEVTENGGYTIEPSWRTNIAKRLAGSTRFPKIERIASLSQRAFLAQRASAHYAVSRAVFMYLHEQGKLGEWYSAYTGSFDEDPTGVRALEAVLGKTMREIKIGRAHV